jgi:hypothetical protein
VLAVITLVPVLIVPRLNDRSASTAGNPAARAAVLAARACSMRAAACASVALSRCAASSSASRVGSSNCAHQRARSVPLPPWGSGACQRSKGSSAARAAASAGAAAAASAWASDRVTGAPG